MKRTPHLQFCYMIKYEISSYFGLWKTWYNDKRPKRQLLGQFDHGTKLSPLCKGPTDVFGSDENEIQD